MIFQGETAVSAPLFKRFIVNAPEGVVSAEEINMHTLEAEVGVTMAQDLRPKPDGSLYTVQEVWQAVESVMPVIEMCGRRSTAECIAAKVRSVPSYLSYLIIVMTAILVIT